MVLGLVHSSGRHVLFRLVGTFVFWWEFVKYRRLWYCAHTSQVLVRTVARPNDMQGPTFELFIIESSRKRASLRRSYESCSKESHCNICRQCSTLTSAR